MSVFQIANFSLVQGADWEVTSTIWSNSQIITITVTSGTITFGFRGRGTGQVITVPYNVTAGALQSALESLIGIGGGNVIITGTGPFTLSWASVLGLAIQPLLTATWTASTGAVDIAPVPFDLTGYGAVLGARDFDDDVLVSLDTTNDPAQGVITLGTTDGTLSWIVYAVLTATWTPASGTAYYDLQLITPTPNLYHEPLGRGALTILRSGL